MNRRAKIRKTVAELIESSTNLKVFHSRKMALQDIELPVAIVSIDSEENELFSRSGNEYKKSADLSIEVIVDAEEGKSCEILDAITNRIESALARNESLSDQVSRCVLKSTEITFVRESELELGFARMNFEVVYFSTLDPSQLGNQIEDPFTGASLYISEVKT